MKQQQSTKQEEEKKKNNKQLEIHTGKKNYTAQKLEEDKFINSPVGKTTS